MGCCQGDNNDPENLEELETCCRIQGPRCMCLPYDDAWVISSMVMSIIAVCISWIWWVTWLISIVGMVLFQLFWCCRQPKATPYLSVAAAVVSSLFSLGTGIYVLIAFRNKVMCDPFSLYSYSSSYWKDSCEEVKWAIIAFVCAALWAVVAGSMIYFVRSGRHAKWEKARSEPTAAATATATASNPNAIVLEMGSAPEPSATARAPIIATAMAALPPATGGTPSVAMDTATTTATVITAPENHKLDSTN